MFIIKKLNIQLGLMGELSLAGRVVLDVSTLPVSPHLCVWQSCAHVSWCTDTYVKCTCIFVYSYFDRLCSSHSGMLQYSSETLRKIGVNWSIPPKCVVRKALFSTRI